MGVLQIMLSPVEKQLFASSLEEETRGVGSLMDPCLLHKAYSKMRHVVSLVVGQHNLYRLINQDN